MLAQFALVPLYLYPNSGAWDPLHKALESYPDLLFSIIINPSSGPGGKAGTLPSDDWINGISKLNAYNNSQLLGYVHTLNGTRALSNVTSDIDAYATWANYTKADLHMDGIFFDESPPSLENSTVRTFMSDVTTYVRDHPYIGGDVSKGVSADSPGHITCNPGVPVADSTEYYSICDTIVAFEDYFASFTTTTTAYPWPDIPSNYTSQTAFVLHDFPAQSTNANYKTLWSTVQDIVVTNNISGLYITTKSDYNEFSANWNQFVDDLANATVPGFSGVTSAASSNLRPWWLLGLRRVGQQVLKTWFSGAR